MRYFFRLVTCNCNALLLESNLYTTGSEAVLLFMETEWNFALGTLNSGRPFAARHLTYLLFRRPLWSMIYAVESHIFT